MHPEYLEESESPYTNKPKALSEALGKFKKRFQQNTPTKKKRGGLNEITDLRAKTAKLLDIPTKQVMGLTRNWTKDQLYRTLKASEDFKPNPPALWWKLYKQNKHIYGRNYSRTLSKNGKKRGKEECGEGQRTLFEDR